MELVATMALDRDAINTVTLRLLPPSAVPGGAASPWLLVHTIPITASLSRTLSRLVSIEASAMAQTQLEASPSVTTTSTALTAPHLLGKGAAAVPIDDTAHFAAPGHAIHRLKHRRMRFASAASSCSASTVSAFSTKSRISCSTNEAQQRAMSWIELVRVGYVVSEIHAYCILFKCRHAAQAARMKAALEEGAALGLTAPVEYVSEARPVIVTHHTFAESRGNGEAMPHHDLHDDHRHGLGATARWFTETHMASLWGAVVTVYPVRGGGDSGVGGGASDDDDEHHSPRGSKQWHQHHPQHLHPLHSSPHAVSSSPPMSSPVQRSRATPSAVRSTGAPPPPPRNTSAVTATPKAHALSDMPPFLSLSGGSGGRVEGRARGSASLLCSDFCAICLDPLYPSACVTTLCQHSFHLSCYALLPSGSAECPLCRFSVYDLLNDARCRVCGTYEDLWVCLICGHVACGRARRDHQQEHYHVSGHSCSWQSSTNRIRNLSSRMYLHQEVALLLEDGVEGAVLADRLHGKDSPTRPHSANPGVGETGALSEGTATRGGATGGASLLSGVDRVQYMSWCDSLADPDLQEALDESKDEAVAQYYTLFLRQLADEQKRWYEAKVAERRRRRGKRQAASTSAGGRGTEPLSHGASSTYTTLHSVALEERRQRRCVLDEYVQSTITLIQAAQLEYTGMSRALRAAHTEAQERVLLRSHLNSGLMAQAEQLRERVRESQQKGEKALQKKATEEATLQRLVDEALSSL
ncbi:hypothetical protein JKF63_07824 [Porcisia hertigi]|uniref:Uncharacterized protein n=1 Tax=Porcisia hertigi TaxID=2761500 RepID=A0A836LMM4_9TRYP|nr:hypothetical protein JKF63_07824 [Porcisia hertigi]